MNEITLPLPNQMYLVVAPHAAAGEMLELAARLATRGPLRVLDGGNRFNLYPVARALRRQTASVHSALERIRLSRAFTCFQMLAMLEATPRSTAPTLLIDFLGTFYDESVTLEEARRLLSACLPHLRRLAESAPLVISAQPPLPLCAERVELVERLQAVCASLGAAAIHASLPTPPMQPTLW